MKAAGTTVNSMHADRAGEQVDRVGAEQEHAVEAELAALAAPDEERQRAGEHEERR